MKGGDRAGLITFGADPQLAEPLRPTPAFSRPQPPAGGRATNLARAIQLAQASLPRGEANRIVVLSDGRENAGQGRGGRPGGEGRRHPDLLHAGRSDVPAGDRRRAAAPAERDQVRRAVLREGRRQLGQGSGRPAVALPQRRVSRLAGRAAHRGEERPDVPSVARAGRGPRLPGAGRGRGRRHRGEQPRHRDHRGARKAPGAPGRQGRGPGPEPGQRPPLPVHRRAARRARGPALDDGRAREVRRRDPVEPVLAQDDRASR